MSKGKFRSQKHATDPRTAQPATSSPRGMRAAADDLASSGLEQELSRLPAHWQESRDEFEEQRLDHILADLDELLSLMPIVEREFQTGKREHAERTLAAMEDCYSDMLRIYRKAQGLEPGTTSEFESRFQQVRDRLDEIRESHRQSEG